MPLSHAGRWRAVLQVSRKALRRRGQQTFLRAVRRLIRCSSAAGLLEHRHGVVEVAVPMFELKGRVVHDLPRTTVAVLP